MISLPVLPIWIVDLAGSALMIVFSFLCVRLARRLRDEDPNNVVWVYLLWVCYVLAAFAVSRSVGHIAKRALLTVGHDDIWMSLRPYSGAINTLTFVTVASVTLFFRRIWKIYREVSRDRQALEKAHSELLYMNRNLEDLVAERTLELTRSEHKYRRMFELSRDMIALVRRDGAILDLNPAGRHMLGLDSPGDGNRDGRPFQSFFQNPDAWEALKESLQRQGYAADTEVLLRRDDKSGFSALVSASVEYEPEGNVHNYHFLVKDISQRKFMRQQLLQADKLASIGQLSAGIAHEINNPLSIILGYTQLLIRGEKEGSQTYEDLRVIEKHIRTCKTIVENLLNFSRSTRTKKTVNDIHKAIDEVVTVVRHHFNLDGIDIHEDLDSDAPPLVIDHEKMKQVFMNLLMNAKQAIGKDGTIRLKTRYEKEAGRITVEVADSGKGIEPQHLSRIFDPFFTTKPTGEGTGLGLSVSYGIVKDHGGDIFVESETGTGSVFTVTLPVSE